jgi:hypothetical protein
MTDPETIDAIAPPLLEQLGALCSLLIHDLANQLCIISGSATFAQMVLSDSDRVAHSLKAIVQAGEKAAHTLGSCGELRRALPETVASSNLPEVLARLKAVTEREKGWSLDVEQDLHGTVRLPAIWAGFAVQCLIKEVRVSGGTIHLQRIWEETGRLGDLGERTDPSSGKVFLRIALSYSSDQPFQVREVRSRYDHMGLLAAFELNRCLGGGLESRSPEPGRQEVRLDLSLIPTDS